MIKIEVMLNGEEEKKVARQIQSGIYRAISDADYISMSIKSDRIPDEGELSIIGEVQAWEA